MSTLDELPPTSKRLPLRIGFLTLKEIREIPLDAPCLLRNKVDEKSITSMIRMSMVWWNHLTKEFLCTLDSLLIDMVTGETEKTFGAYKGTKLNDKIEAICKDFMGRLKLGEQESVMMALKWELSTPDTEIELHKTIIFSNLVSSVITPMSDPRVSRSLPYTSAASKA